MNNVPEIDAFERYKGMTVGEALEKSGGSILIRIPPEIYYSARDSKKKRKKIKKKPNFIAKFLNWFRNRSRSLWRRKCD